ncbi:MAG: redoxin domain-containing protein [Bdellovibrionales bacterium]|nr:redoxin domain-containing protein [Bdellovibrionales bacterium]
MRSFWFFVLGLCLCLLAVTAHANSPTSFGSLDDLSGGPQVSWKAAQAKKGTVLVFLSSKCPCSASHEKALRKLTKEFKDFQFLGIHSNQDEKVAVASAYFRKAALPFPVVQDTGAKLADAFRAFKTPHAFLIDPSGEQLFSGGIDDSKDHDRASHHYLKEALEAVRDGGKPNPQRVRALGCVIQRK